MQRATAKFLYILSVLVYFCVAFLSAKAQSYTVLIVATVIWIVILLVLSHFLRCPHCGAYPRRGSLFHHYCPRCGEPLD